MTTLDELLVKLRAMYSHRGDGIPTQYVNPDGPAAADALEAAARENERLLAENQAASRNVYRLQADGVQFCEALAEIADASWPGPDAVDRIRALAKRSLGRTT